MSPKQQPRSYTVWERLEPVTRNYELTETLRAEVRDPAWLLARQWQVGEFQGNDGGSPVAVDLEYVQETLSSVDLPDGTDSIPYAPGSSPPLEAVVERERILTDEGTGPNYRVRVEAGMNFLARLREQRRNEASNSEPSLPDPTEFPETLQVGGETVDLRVDMDGENLDEAGRRFELVAGEKRSLDGYGIYRALDEAVPGIADGTPAWQQADAAELPLPDDADGTVSSAFETAALGFYEWYVDLYDEPGADTGDAWNEDRLEYEFEATTATDGTETTFAATEYDGGGLDWDDFSATGSTTDEPTPESLDPSRPPTDESAEPAPTPTRLTFRGMPAPRYWEMEDADVDLSVLSAAPEDVSWLTMAEIALTAGNKWFAIPLEAPYGSFTRFTKFEVVDTFVEHPVDSSDETTTMTAARSEWTDRAGTLDGKGWNAYLFDVPDRDEPGLLLPPVVGSSLRSDPVERVRFTRDEAANLVFAIENLAEGPLGDPLDRREFDRPKLEVSTVHPSNEPDDEYVELRNTGDDDLDVDGWALNVEVARGPFEFDGNTLAAGSLHDVYTFSGVTIEPGSSIRLYTGGTPTHDTADRLHVGAEKPLWGRSEMLATYVVDRPAPASSDDERETVLADPVGTTEESSLPRYVLATDVPDHWFPLKAADTGTDDYRLEVALLMDADTLDETIYRYPRPMGQVLSPHASVHDEAITEAGTTIERGYTLALGADGRGHCWSGRAVSTGGSDESSGLRYDFLEEPSAGGGSDGGE